MSSNLGNDSSANGQIETIHVTLTREQLKDLRGKIKVPKVPLISEKPLKTYSCAPSASSDARKQSEVDPNWKVELSSLQNELKSVKKSVEDLKDLVKSQNQEKPQKDQETGPNENVNQQNSAEKHGFENPFSFEPSLKRVKLEDQSEEIQKLKEDNLEQSKEIEKLNQIVKNLREDNLKLYRENCDLKYGIDNST